MDNERCDAILSHCLYAYSGFSHFIDSLLYPTKLKSMTIMELIPSCMKDSTLESCLSRISTRSTVIYCIIIGFIAIILSVLHIVHVVISIQARGLFSQGSRSNLFTLLFMRR